MRLSDTDHPGRQMVELEISRFPRKVAAPLVGPQVEGVVKVNVREHRGDH
jgi:hypothetical protein